MQTFKIVTAFTSLLTFSLIALSIAHADENRPLRPGRGNGSNGNEQSRRVDHVTTGQVAYRGNGCPQGTMQVVFAPDNLSFSVLFDQFVAQINDSTNDRRGLMSCDAQFVIQLPAGMQMEITRVDFRGFVGLPQNGRATLASSFNFLGNLNVSGRMNLNYQFAGPVMDNYEISSDNFSPNGAPTSSISPCGGPALLRISNRLSVISQVHGQQSTVTLDSIDAQGSAHATYYVNWRACGASLTPSPSPAPAPPPNDNSREAERRGPRPR